MNKSLWVILTLGIILRLVISPFTYHSDIQPFDLGGFVIAKGYALNFYDFFPNLSSADQIKQTFHDYNFNYPPAVYFFLGLIANFFSIFVGSDFRYQFLFNVKNTLGTLPLFVHLLTLKLPYLLFDIAIALLLSKMFTSQRQKILAVSIWIFNPVNLFATYFMGGFDIIPVFFTILSLYFIVKDWQHLSTKNLSLSALALGIGSSFKIYPLFFLIPLASLTENRKKRLQILLIGAIPYLLTILPFLPSHGFRSSALVAGQTLKSLYAQIPLSGGESIMLFIAILVFIYLVFLKLKISGQNLWQRYLLVMLVFFTLTHFHPQWLLWLVPFLILERVHANLENMLPLFLIIFSWFGQLFFFDPGLTVGLFAPVFPSLYDSQSIWQILHLNPDFTFFRSILQSLFVGSALYYLYLYFPRKNDN